MPDSWSPSDGSMPHMSRSTRLRIPTHSVPCTIQTWFSTPLEAALELADLSLLPLMLFARRYGRKVGMLFGLYLLSFLPIVGRFVMPVVSFFTFRENVGTTSAAVIFGTGLVLPKRVLVTFLHTYFASRSLMRELVRQIRSPRPVD